MGRAMWEATPGLDVAAKRLSRTARFASARSIVVVAVALIAPSELAAQPTIWNDYAGSTSVPLTYASYALDTGTSVFNSTSFPGTPQINATIGAATPNVAISSMPQQIQFTHDALAEETKGRARLWASAEAIWWQISKAPQPTPLVTSGTAAGAFTTPTQIPGAIGQAGTSVLIGGTSVSLPVEFGGRFALGGWIDRAAGVGLEVGSFFLAPGTTRQRASTDGSTVMAVPIFDISGHTSGGRPGESVFVLPGSFPGGLIFAGQMERAMSAQMLGAEISGVYSVRDNGRTKIELLGGYRWLQFKETLDFYVSTEGIGPANPGQITMLHDGFYTNNYFNGVQLGIRGEVDYGGFVAQASLKAALGDMYQRLSIEGGGLTTAGTVFFPVSGGAGNNLAGGIFAQPSNIGSYGSHQLSGLAEVGARLGYRLTVRIVPYISYNALYVGGVLRPGDAVNRNINTTTTPLAAASIASGNSVPVGGPTGPTVETKSTDVWTQGISVGLTISL